MIKGRKDELMKEGNAATKERREKHNKQMN
jgi:hypothetical protein